MNKKNPNQKTINMFLLLSLVSITFFIYYINISQPKPYTIIRNYKIDNNISKEKRVSFKVEYSNFFFTLTQKDIRINNETKKITLALLTDRFIANLLIGNTPAINSNTGVQMLPYDIFIGNDKLIIKGKDNLYSDSFEYIPDFIKLIDKILNENGEIEISINLEKVMFFEDGNLTKILD